MKQLFPFLKRYRKECVLAPLFKLIETLFDLTVPLVIAFLIDKGISAHDTEKIWIAGAILAALALMGMGFSFIAQYFAAKAATGTVADLRSSLFSHIQKFSFSQLDKQGASTLINRLTLDMNQIQNGINMALRLLLRSPFVVFGAMFMAFTVSKQIGLYFALMTILLGFVVYYIMKKTTAGQKAIRKQMDDLSCITRENINGVRVLRAFNKQESEIIKFGNLNDKLEAMQLKIGRLDGAVNPITGLIVNAVLILVLYSGAVSVNTGSLTSGEVIALTNYLAQILVELIKFANLLVTIAKAMAGASRVADVLNIVPEQERSVSAENSISNTLLRLKNVCVRYPGSQSNALNDISFDLKQGETLGVIGGTGSGKSTLVNAIPAFYDITGGSIEFDGKNIAGMNLNELRRQISVVAQKAQLFSGTIRENITLGKPDATDEEVQIALQQACADSFVSEKPKGILENVEQNGSNLSGGQRQRLSIARALINRSKLLILDDATSALDYLTERNILNAMYELPEHPAVIIVSQRMKAVRNADRILVLDNGHCVGYGTHDELLNSCETYREICESQMSGE